MRLATRTADRHVIARNPDESLASSRLAPGRYKVKTGDHRLRAPDALLGLSTIATNNVFRVLTVASVIAITPTFLASMYGMNFKHMPELGWTYGYDYALVLIARSALIPAVWFKVKGWW